MTSSYFSLIWGIAHSATLFWGVWSTFCMYMGHSLRLSLKRTISPFQIISCLLKVLYLNSRIRLTILMHYYLTVFLENFAPCQFENCLGGKKLTKSFYSFPVVAALQSHSLLPWVLLSHLGQVFCCTAWCSSDKGFHLINSPKLISTLRSENCSPQVASLPLFYHYYHGFCSRELAN